MIDDLKSLRRTISAHFIHAETGIFAKRLIEFAPSAGDELRFSGERYFKVVRLVWVYDEPETPYARLNIEITEAP